MRLFTILILGIFTIACATVDGPDREVASDEEKSESKEKRSIPQKMFEYR